MFLQIYATFLLFCGFCYGNERNVAAKIFEGYEKRIRPVHNSNTITVVGIQLQILNLLEVMWQDEYLTWDPEKYGGLQYIRVPSSMVWTPDFSIVTTSLQPDDFIPKDEQVLGIHHTGNIDYTFPFVHTNNCVMKNDDFPFDEQECVIKVTSWKYPSHLISMEHKWQNNTLPRNPNTEWEIFPFFNTTVNFRRELEPPDEDGLFRNVNYHLKIKRKSTYYVWVIIVPTFIISALSIAGIFAPFSNHGLRQEKITLGLTTLLTLTIILSLVTDFMPKGTRLPVLGTFIFLELVICTLSMAVSVVLLFLHQRATTRHWEMPKCITSFCMRNPFLRKEEATYRKKSFFYPNGSNKPSCNITTPRQQQDNSIPQLENCLSELKGTLRVVRDSLQDMKNDENREYQWIVVLDHLDMFFCILFQIINIVNVVAVLVHTQPN